ncbi:MAG: long-chain fatty acid--CoA ligase [Nitrospinota bacterium]
MDKPWVKFYEDQVPPEIEFPDISLPQLFERSVANNPNGSAASFFGKKITYTELGRLVDQFAIALTRLGVKQGDRVAIMLPNIPQYPIVHFAALKIGAILVPTNPLYVERELQYQLNNSGAETIIALDIHFPKIEKVKPETGLRNVIITSVQEYLPGLLKLLYPIKAKKEGNWYKVNRAPGIHFFEDLITEKFVAISPDIDVKPDDIAMFLYTGGTTGVSKGAVLTHRNLVANVIQIRTWYCEVKNNEEVVLCALPFFHSYGLTTCLHMAVLLGSTMILIPNPRDIKTILKAIQKEKATLFSGVPTLFVAINNFPEISKYDLSSIKACVSGGAPLPLEVARQFEEISHGALVEGYGLSETSPVTHANSINGKRKEGSIGTPLPNTDATIVDPETKKPLPKGEVGELAVKGPQVMKGYWKMEKETKEVLGDGWLYTGDMSKMDEDGYFYIVDRIKDMIIAGGFNIYPREIEEVLYEHPKILEAAVIGVPDEYRGETVRAFVVLKEGASLSSAGVIEFCKSRLAPFKVPKLVEFRDSLPKSNIGKVLRRMLKEEIESIKAVSNTN